MAQERTKYIQKKRQLDLATFEINNNQLKFDQNI